MVNWDERLSRYPAREQEVQGLLQKYQIEELLVSIRDQVWKGEGEILPHFLKEDLPSKYLDKQYLDSLPTYPIGYNLVYTYPYPGVASWMEDEQDWRPSHHTKDVVSAKSSILMVRLINYEAAPAKPAVYGELPFSPKDLGPDKLKLLVYDPPYIPYNFIEIYLDDENKAREDLVGALEQSCIGRKRLGGLPTQLKQEGESALRAKKLTP